MMSSIALVPPGTGGVQDYAFALSAQLHAPVTALAPTIESESLPGNRAFLYFSGYDCQKSLPPGPDWCQRLKGGQGHE